MHYTFNKQEFKEFLMVEFLEIKGDYDEELKIAKESFESSKYWEVKISILNHLFAIILEQFEKRNIEGQKIIDFIYTLPEIYDFYIQETDIRFIDTLYKSCLNESLTLDDYLIDTQYNIFKT